MEIQEIVNRLMTEEDICSVVLTKGRDGVLDIVIHKLPELLKGDK